MAFDTYHAQVIGILKFAVICFAIMLPVAVFFHVLFRSVSATEYTVAGVAIVFWLPMLERIHMLISSILTPEHTIACLAFMLRRPVVNGVHVLAAG